jgi:WD40 repeat protein
MKKSDMVFLIILFFIGGIVFPSSAADPTWTYTSSNSQIEDLVVTPDGSAVISVTGKVLLLSGDGTFLANEPFGERIAQSRDGSTIITVYSSAVSSTVYLFMVGKDANGNPSLQKQWDAVLPGKVNSFAVSDNGERIAVSLGGTGIGVYDGKTGDRLGYSDEYSSFIAISGTGSSIAGVSAVQGLKIYDSQGTMVNKYDVNLAGQPGSLLMDTNGSMIVINPGPYVVALNTSKGDEIWKKKARGNINMLAMTPSGNAILAGTDDGTIAYYDTNGNLTWTYSSDSESGSGHAIRAVALTEDGSKIIAGSVDGKIILLDSAGNSLSTYTTKNDGIVRVAIASDGSLAVASGENTIYAFTTEPRETQGNSTEISQETASQTMYPDIYSTLSTETTSTSRVIPITTRTVYADTPTVTVTEFSVIRKATPSPLDEPAGIIAILIVCLFFQVRGINRER